MQTRATSNPPPLILGLTGGTGAGKGEACKIFKSLGFYIIDCDQMAKSYMDYGEDCYFEVKNHFGHKILSPNGEIDRKILGQLVFDDKVKLVELSKIVHRYVKSGTIEQIRILQTTEKLILIDAPVLIEANMQELVHYIVGIFACQNLRLERIIKRDNISQIQAKSRIAAQMDGSVLKKHIDFEINNNQGISELKVEIEKLLFGLGLC